MPIAATTSLNSTTVRFSDLAAKALRSSLRATLRSYFALTSRLLPALAQRQAEHLFTMPPPYAGRGRRDLEARRETVRAGTEDIAVWRAGPSDAPAVLLVHGWGGRGEQLAGIVPLLRARGFRVVWFDHPGHGDNRRRAVGLPDFVRALAALETTHGPFAAAVGHSLGAAAIALGLRHGLRYGRVVLIGPPTSLGQHAHDFSRWIGISAAVREAMRSRIEARYGVRFSDIDRIEDLATRHEPALIVHDADDRHVAFSHAEKLAHNMPQAHLLRTHGLGHHRILRDPAVLSTVAEFVAGRSTGLPSVLPALPDPAPLY